MYGHSKATTPEGYIAELAEPRRSEIQKLHDFIRKVVPELEPFMQGGTQGNMLGYGTLHYKYASGREGDWFKVGIANNKNYISLYVCAFVDGKYIAESHAESLYSNGKPNVGRSCIRYKTLNDVNWDGLEKVLKLASKQGTWGV